MDESLEALYVEATKRIDALEQHIRIEKILENGQSKRIEDMQKRIDDLEEALYGVDDGSVQGKGIVELKERVKELEK